jgi:hypothetical protein
MLVILQILGGMLMPVLLVSVFFRMLMLVRMRMDVLMLM